VRSSRFRAGLAALGTCSLLLLQPVAPTAQADAAPTLTDDAGGAALFPGAEPIEPGASADACITISATGALASDRVTIAATEVTGDLAPFLTVTVEVGTGGRYGDCTGFSGQAIYQGTLIGLAGLAGDGAPTGWEPTLSPARTFRITVTVAATSDVMGRTSTASFSWRLLRLDEPGPTPTPTPTPTQPRPSPEDPPVTVTPDPVVTTPSASPALVPEPTVSGTPQLAPAVPATASPGPSSTQTPRPATSERPVARLDVPVTGSRPRTQGRDWHEVSTQVFQMLNQVVKQPGFTIGPLGVALLFLFTQHLIDMRDPKLASASRTFRETTLAFPTDYLASFETTESGQ
jgi:hypothetical protein